MRLIVSFHKGKRMELFAQSGNPGDVKRAVLKELSEHLPCQVHVKGGTGYVQCTDHEKEYFNYTLKEEEDD